MNIFDSLPWWIAAPVAFFMMLGATLTFLGTLGLVRLKSFYDRLHAPTLGTSWGTAGILLASMILVSWTQSRVVMHELVIGIFVMISTPVTLMLLGRAALHRDRTEGTKGIPGALSKAGPEVPAPLIKSENEALNEAEPDPKAPGES